MNVDMDCGIGEYPESFTSARNCVMASLQESPWVWNDRPGRTFDEVIEVLEKAEKIAEELEEE